MTTYRLRSLTRTALIDALAEHGFTFTDADGQPTTPQGGEVIVNAQGWGCKYLAKTIPVQEATYDEEGNELTPTVFSTYWHADVLAPEGLTFNGVDIATPNTPYHAFA